MTKSGTNFGSGRSFTRSRNTRNVETPARPMVELVLDEIENIFIFSLTTRQRIGHSIYVLKFSVEKFWSLEIWYFFEWNQSTQNIYKSKFLAKILYQI